MSRTAFVGTKTYYYKLQAARAELDHAHAPRSGFTRSQNVHSDYSRFNLGYYYHGASSCNEALDLMCEKHKAVTGKKVRSDCNVLFEHIVWLSEHQYRRLEKHHGPERVRDAFLARLQLYARSVRQEFGFEPLGIDLHFDEGHFCESEKRFIRNIHAHVQFFNYSFEKRIAPLRHLMNNGKDSAGRTNALNPNFVKLQNLVAAPFKNMGFERGESKHITGREHQRKEQFVINKLKTAQQKNDALQQECNQLTEQLIQHRTENKQLAEEIVVKQQEAASLTIKVQTLKKQFQHLEKLIKQKAISAVRQFSSRFVRQQPSNKLTR